MKIKKIVVESELISGFTALFLGVIVHLFMLVNPLHNYDDIASLPSGYGTGVSSGRWLLGAIGNIASSLGLNYNLPVLNGLAFLALMAVAAAMLTRILGIRRKLSAILLGGLVAVFPASCSMLFFRFTAVYYAVSILLSIAAVYTADSMKHGPYWSVIFVVLSLGIYQANIPFTIGLFVLLLLRRSLEGKSAWFEIVKAGLKYCGILAVGYVVYYFISKGAVAFVGSALSDYRGIENMGRIDLMQLPMTILRAVKNACKLPFRDYCGLAYRKVIQLAYLLLAVSTIPMIVWILLGSNRKAGNTILSCLLLCVFPLAVNFIEVMVPDGGIYTLMLYPMVLLPCLPLMLLELLPQARIGEYFRYSITTTVAALVLLYGYFANVNYLALYFVNRQVENYVSSIVVQVRMTEGYRSDMEWALLGEIDDLLLDGPWDEEAVYGGIGGPEYLLNQYSLDHWFQHYVGYDIPFADKERIQTISKMDEISSMPCWPDYGSIRIIDNTVIIKGANIPHNG